METHKSDVVTPIAAPYFSDAEWQLIVPQEGQIHGGTDEEKRSTNPLLNDGYSEGISKTAKLIVKHTTHLPVETNGQLESRRTAIARAVNEAVSQLRVEHQQEASVALKKEVDRLLDKQA